MTSRRSLRSRNVPQYHSYGQSSEFEILGGDVDVDILDVGWPLLRFGGQFFPSLSSRWEAVSLGDSRRSEASRLSSRELDDSLLDATKSSFNAVESGRFQFLTSTEITEVDEEYHGSTIESRPPPIVFLKPCRQLEKQYTASGRSIAEQLTILKGRLDKIAEDPSFRHSHHGRLAAKETVTNERDHQTEPSKSRW